MQTTQINKQELIDWIENMNDHQTLRLLQSLKNSQTEGDWWDGLPQTIKDNIDLAAKEADEGKGIPHDEVMAEVKEQFHA
jgi:predicted transcriptional regulator